MNEFLTEAFGENGPRIGQFAVTTLVVLVLLLLVYWIARRVWGDRIGGMPRGRVPRLAIVDVLAIDGRRRLLLVRRDAVEHLILIGGPTDIVVEPSILRPRQRVAQGSVGGQSMPIPPPPMSAAAPPGAEEASRPAAGFLAPGAQAAEDRENPPPPFPLSRIAAAAPIAGLSDLPADTTADPADSEFGPPPAWFAQRDPIVAPDAPHRAVPVNGTTVHAAGDDEPEPLFPRLGGFGRASNGNGTHAPPSSQKREAAVDDTAAHRVSELEAEMNRLLGQLTADRRSP